MSSKKCMGPGNRNRHPTPRRRACFCINLIGGVTFVTFAALHHLLNLPRKVGNLRGNGRIAGVCHQIPAAPLQQGLTDRKYPANCPDTGSTPSIPIRTNVVFAIIAVKRERLPSTVPDSIRPAAMAKPCSAMAGSTSMMTSSIVAPGASATIISGAPNVHARSGGSDILGMATGAVPNFIRSYIATGEGQVPRSIVS